MEFEKKDLKKSLIPTEVEGNQLGVGALENGTYLNCFKSVENKTVLLIVCCLFGAFAISEMVGAVYASSLAMLGDATATSVDVLSYCSNYYAEHIASVKNATPVDPGDRIELAVHRKQRTKLDARTKMIHEVYVPAFSVLTLICATIVILVLAALEINKGGDDDTKEMYMFAFASVNAGIDTVCITMFYQRKDDVLHRRFPTIIGDDMSETTESTITVPPKQPILRSANINMFSAFTHIGCDTLRTLAIFLSAIVSSTTGTKSSLCDAWAAVVVSITIFIAVIPLSLEVYAAYTGKR